jgi:hypothetical protein
MVDLMVKVGATGKVTTTIAKWISPDAWPDGGD